jgi:hypothetical protein
MLINSVAQGRNGRTLDFLLQNPFSRIGIGQISKQSTIAFKSPWVTQVSECPTQRASPKISSMADRV